MSICVIKLAAAGAVACALLVSAADAQTTVKKGVEAWKDGDYAGAVAAWRPLAEAGNAKAAFNLGEAYRLGRGVPLDLAQAQRWLDVAAHAGMREAQTALGLMLYRNGNRVTGLRWLRQAADQGEPRAMLVYGAALFNGDGVPRDPVAAYAYVHRAAALGLRQAKEALAQMGEILPAEQRQKALTMAPSAQPKRPPSSEAPERPSAAPKSSKRSEASKAAQHRSGRWRVQLGAFSSASAAKALYRSLAHEAPVAGHEVFYVPLGKLTRVQVGPFANGAAAENACAALKAKDQACFPVAPE